MTYNDLVQQNLDVTDETQTYCNSNKREVTYRPEIAAGEGRGGKSGWADGQVGDCCLHCGHWEVKQSHDTSHMDPITAPPSAHFFPQTGRVELFSASETPYRC